MIGHVNASQSGVKCSKRSEKKREMYPGRSTMPSTRGGNLAIVTARSEKEKPAERNLSTFSQAGEHTSNEVSTSFSIRKQGTV